MNLSSCRQVGRSVTITLLAVGCAAGSRPTPVPVGREAQTSAEALAYLHVALDSIEQTVLRGTRVAWPVVRDSAVLLVRGAQRPYDTYPAIDWALRRVNKHSFLQVSTPGAVSRMIAGGIGYIHVPQRGGSGIALADSLHGAVGTLQAAGACAWIVDVRANGGGNMWPMLAGIGPLLGDTIVGSFGGQPLSERWYYRDGVAGILSVSGKLDTISRVTVSPVQPLNPGVPIAVLFDGGTGSSGEAVVIAFAGRPNSKTFGSRSAGFATVNRGLRLADGANMVVTTGHNADRRGQSYGDQLNPDITVALPSGWPSPTDRVSAAAEEWLTTQGSCLSRR